MALDVGELRATLKLEGADDFERDLAQVRSRFSELGQAGQRAGQQAEQGFAGIGSSLRREANQADQAASRFGNAGQQAGQRFGQGFNSGADDGFRRAESGAAQAGQRAGAGAGAGVEGGMAARLARLGTAGGPVGVAILGIAAIGVTAGKALADNIMAGMEKQALANKDKAKFGWTEEQAAAAGKAAAAAYTNAWGGSIAENRTAIGTAIQSGLLDGNATAEQMQPVVEKLNVITEIMGTGIPETARAAGQMVRTGLAKDATEALDLLTAAQQNGLNVSDDLLETITEYGTQYRKLGIDGATALGTIQQMVQAGARDTDVAADALKEFSLKVLDGSKTTTGAFEMLGLNVQDTKAKFAEGGKAASDMTQVVWTKLQGVQDQVARNNIGLALFGTKWEDLGGAINGMDLSTAAQQLGNIGGAAERAAKTMGGTQADFESAKRTIETALGDVQVKLAEAFGPSLSQAAQWVSEHTDEISRAFEIVGGTIGMVAAAVGMIGGTIVGAVGEIIEHTAKLVRGALSPIFTAMEKLGGVMASMPGKAGDVGRAMQNAAGVGRTWIDTWVSAGEATSDFGWGLARASNEIGLSSAAIAKGEERAKTATEAFAGLGIKVREVPDEKRIVIEDNSPETKAKLEELGIKVQTLPDGSLYIDTDDEDAKAKIAELTKPEVKTIVVTTTQAKIGEELKAVNERRVAMGMKPLTAEEFGTGSAGAGIGGTGLSSTGGKITVKVTDGPKTKPSSTTPETVVQQTTEEKEEEAKAAEKAAKAAEAAKKKAEAAKAKEEKEKAAAAKKATEAAAKIPGLETALAIAEQKARELKPDASVSSRMTAQQAVTKAREALEKARTEAKGATTTGTTGTTDNPVTVTGDGKGGTVQVGTGNTPLKVEPANSAQGDGMRVFVTNMPAGGLGGGIKLSLFAGGGSVRGPGTGTSDSIPAMLSNGEYVVNAAATARFGGLLEAINSGRVARFQNGGIVANPGVTGGTVALGNISGEGITTQGQQDAWDAIRQQFPGASLNSATRTQDVGSGFDFHMAGEAIDIGGSPELMMQIAEWIATNYPNSRELIHGPGFAKQIKNGKIVGDGGGDYGFYAGAGRHDDHVHWTPPSGFTFGGAAGGVPGLNATAVLAGVGNLTAQSTRKEIAAAIIGEAKKRGYTDEEARAILATAMQESDLKMQDGGGGAWKGIFQQDSSYAGRDDPNTNISGFFDRLDEKRKGAPGGDIWKDIFWLQQRPGEASAEAAYSNGRQAYLSEIQSKLDPADSLMREVLASMPASSTATTGAGTAPIATTGSSGTQNVYVTGGKLDSVGSGTGGSQFKFSLFSQGGHVRGPGGPTSDSIPAMLSNGEYVVNAASTRANYPLLEAINRSGGALRLAGGGIAVAPKIEAPKITPTLGPGMPLPIPQAGVTPQVGTGTGTGGFDPLASLGLGAGAQQSAVPGTGDATTGQQYTVQRLMQYGGDMAKIGIQALKEILLPSGLDSAQAANVLNLVKGVGSGISSSAQKAETSTTTKTGDGKNVTITNNHTWNVSSADEAYRNLKRDEGRKALTYDGSLT